MVVDEMLSSGLVGDIADLIEACHFPEDAFLLIERQPDEVIKEKDKLARWNLLRFTHLYSRQDESKAIHDEIRAEIKRSTSGRIFQENFELRWERLDHRYQVVYLGEERKILGLEPNKEVLKNVTRKSEARRYYLFGTKLDARKLQDLGLKEGSGYFAEVRVPRLLHYPIETDAMRVQLHVCEYVDDKTGQVQLFRFQKPAKEVEGKA